MLGLKWLNCMTLKELYSFKQLLYRVPLISNMTFGPYRRYQKYYAAQYFSIRTIGKVGTSHSFPYFSINIPVYADKNTNAKSFRFYYLLTINNLWVRLLRNSEVQKCGAVRLDIWNILLFVVFRCNGNCLFRISISISELLWRRGRRMTILGDF